MYEKNKMLVWLVLTLIIMNLGSLGFLWYRETIMPPKPIRPPRAQDRPIDFIANELQLSEDQITAFRELQRNHQKQTAELRRGIHKLSKDIIDELFRQNPDTARVTVMANEIGQKQAAFEKSLFDHFGEFKEVCNPEQEEKLRGLLFDLLERKKNDNPPPRPGNRGDREPPPRHGENRDRKPPPGG